MQIAGEYQIPAARERVWRALNDPAVLRRCIPGCQSLEKTSDTQISANLALVVGPVQTHFDTRFVLSEIEVPSSYRLSGEGRGGAVGFARGTSAVALEEDGQNTVLRYEGTVEVGGKLARIGSRVLNLAARKLATEFFDALAEEAAATPDTARDVPSGAPSRWYRWAWVPVVVLAALWWAWRYWGET